MPVTYSYDRSRNLVRSEAWGALTTGDFRDYTSRILDDAEIRPGFIEALVIRPDARLEIRYADLPPFRDVWKAYLRKGVRGTLIQAESDAGFGIFRMFESTIASEDLNPDIQFELVRGAEDLEQRIGAIRARFPVED